MKKLLVEPEALQAGYTAFEKAALNDVMHPDKIIRVENAKVGLTGVTYAEGRVCITFHDGKNATALLIHPDDAIALTSCMAAIMTDEARGTVLQACMDAHRMHMPNAPGGNVDKSVDAVADQFFRF